MAKFDAVIVLKLDRLSRSQKDTLHLIEDVFMPNDVDFISVQESFDTSTAFGRAMVGILSVFAQLERENIRERTSSGRQGRAEDGLFHGGGKRPIGYSYENGKLHINEHEAMIIRMIYDQYLAGMGKSMIARILKAKGLRSDHGEISPTVVNNILKNPLYTGRIGWKGKIHDGEHEAIISIKQYESAMEFMKKRHNVKSYQGAAMLSGILYCNSCGNKLYRKSCRGYYYYQCNSRLKRGKANNGYEACKLRIWKQEDVDAIVDREIRQLVFDTDYLKEVLADHQSESPKSLASHEKQIEIIESKINDLNAQIKKLMKLYLNDKMPIKDISAEIEKYNDERNLLSAQLEHMRMEMIDQEEAGQDASITDYLEDVQLIWNDADELQKKQILSALINKIVVHDDHIDIRWSFL